MSDPTACTEHGCAMSIARLAGSVDIASALTGFFDAGHRPLLRVRALPGAGHRLPPLRSRPDLLRRRLLVGRSPEQRSGGGRRYQRSRNGRLAHAERMRRYRTRLNKVTHQGSAAAAADALLQAPPTTSAKATTPGIARRLPAHCQFCQRACSALVRLGPLRTRVFQHVRTAIDITGHDP